MLISEDGRRAYFGDLQGKMYAVETRTGNLIWNTRVDDISIPKLPVDRN